jgi:predicted TIM-barrel fold metal-dependent hydrolase
MLMAGPGVLGGMYSQRAAAAVTEKDRTVFREKAEAIAKLPIVGFGEFGIVHMSIPMMGPQHPYEAVPADHPLLLILSDIAAKYNLPIDIHFDLVLRDMDLPPQLENPNARHPNPSRLLQNRDELERFLAHNRETKIIWAHVGGEPLATRTPWVVRELLMRNSNLFMSFRIQRVRPDVAADALTMQGQLNCEWSRLITEYPDRFLLGTDTFYQDSRNARGGDSLGLENLQRMLLQLPPDVARKVATGNVARIYRVN